MSDLAKLMEQTKARIDSMTDTERAEMHRAQRESWVRGMCTPCEHGELDFEQCQECRSGSRLRDGNV
ncbi:hypothetical protein [Shinella zoogloeoides]|uniref:hypothetical protein n=1 Tax=Shinella zoogloeoides TaxID=352475 RepID=UPI0028AE4FB7|nr:hypothetical protein [Shinella zoogloeoides]